VIGDVKSHFKQSYLLKLITSCIKQVFYTSSSLFLSHSYFILSSPSSFFLLCKQLFKINESFDLIRLKTASMFKVTLLQLLLTATLLLLILQMQWLFIEIKRQMLIQRSLGVMKNFFCFFLKSKLLAKKAELINVKTIRQRKAARCQSFYYFVFKNKQI